MPDKNDSPRFVNGTYDQKDTDWQNAFGELDGRPANLLRQDALAEMDKPKSSPAYNSMKADFKYIDLDGNGFLDSAEIALAAKNDPNLAKLDSDKKAQYDIKRMVDDGKNDAKGISINDVDEFGRRVSLRDHAQNDPGDLTMAAEFLNKYFDRLNRKKDGFLSKEDLNQLIVDPNLKPSFREKFMLMERYFDNVSDLQKDKVLKSKEHQGLSQGDLKQLISLKGQIMARDRR